MKRLEDCWLGTADSRGQQRGLCRNKKERGVPAPVSLSPVAPVAITSPVVIAVTMAMRLAHANGNAGFAAVDTDAAATTHAISIPRMAMPSTGASPA